MVIHFNLNLKTMKDLKLIAQQMTARGKGILAADESTPTCSKRFEALGIESTDLTRNEYRSKLLLSENIENYISSVILFDETFHQTLQGTNTPIPAYLKQKNILTGIKVDTGAKTLSNHDPEKITEGLDGLRDRLTNYKLNGADFAKWRAVITIGDNIPSQACLHSNAHALARYASLCQENDIVTIVDPEVLMDGAHGIEKCFHTTEKALKEVFNALKLLNVDLEAIVLKPNMVLPGNLSDERIEDSQIIKMTFDALKKNVPKEVPGIAFLSGGQNSDKAAERLNLLNQQYPNKDWNLTFSYGRALQQDALFCFSKGDILGLQKALLKRAKMNHLASIGQLFN